MLLHTFVAFVLVLVFFVQANQLAETRYLIRQVGVFTRGHGMRLESAMREGAAPSSTVMA